MLPTDEAVTAGEQATTAVKQAILDPASKAPSGVLEARSISVFLEDEDEEGADDGASNAAATRIGLGLNTVKATTRHDEPIQCPRHQILSVRSRRRRTLLYSNYSDSNII